MRAVFVDTSALVALKNKSDTNHLEASRCFQELLATGTRLITTNFVFDETYTLLQRRMNHEVAVEFGKTLRASEIIRYLRITKELEDKAWEIAVKYKDKSFSFTDCTSFAVMESLGIREAFAFDECFGQFGLQVVP
ncbi:MAG: 23S rRNA-specific endonuclease VapC20 [Actinobacteria bacterium]|nr:23S rRNA-specific endonuclease VapC20 [Actinomycetota bacterium]